MKNLMYLFSTLLILFVQSSCETQKLNDEIYESELQMVDPGEDGTVDDGNRRED